MLIIQKKLILIGCLYLLVIPCFGQTTKVLRLKNKAHYVEENILTVDSSVNVVNKISYNVPLVMDEEYMLLFTINFIDTSDLRVGQIFNVQTDTARIRCYFNLLSVWRWEERPTKITGNVTIISWSSQKIEIALNVAVLDRGNRRTYIYKGRRVFVKKINS